MQIPVFHIYRPQFVESSLLRSAGLKERFVAQCIDGIMLSLLINVILLVFSKGELYAVWISPLFPLFLVQVPKTYLAFPADWWWGGYFLSIDLPYLAEFHLAYPSILQFAVYGLYYSLFHSWWGQTPGKMMKGLVVLEQDGRFISFGKAVLRWIAYFPSLFLLGIGFWVAEKHPEKISWPDRWTNTRVYSFLPWIKS